MVIPDIQLRDLCISSLEGFCSVPANVVVEVVVVASGPHIFVEGEVPTLYRVANVSPGLIAISECHKNVTIIYNEYTFSGPSTRTPSL